MNYSTACDFQGVLFLNLDTVGPKKPIRFYYRVKSESQNEKNLWLQRERADSKIFELIKELQVVH